MLDYHLQTTEYTSLHILISHFQRFSLTTYLPTGSAITKLCPVRQIPNNIILYHSEQVQVSVQ